MCRYREEPRILPPPHQGRIILNQTGPRTWHILNAGLEHGAIGRRSVPEKHKTRKLNWVSCAVGVGTSCLPQGQMMRLVTLKVCDTEVVRGMLWRQGEGRNRGMEKTGHEELHGLYSSCNIRMFKWIGLKWQDTQHAWGDAKCVPNGTRRNNTVWETILNFKMSRM